MPDRLPAKILFSLAFLAFASLAAGLWLESSSLRFLQGHPYLVNLLSSITGFSTSILVVALGFNWLTSKERIRKRRYIIGAALGRALEHMIAIAILPLERADDGSNFSGRAFYGQVVDKDFFFNVLMTHREIFEDSVIDVDKLVHHASQLTGDALPALQLELRTEDEVSFQKSIVEFQHVVLAYERERQRSSPAEKSSARFSAVALRLYAMIDELTKTRQYKAFVRTLEPR
ncbi:hypothetical protein [Actinoplanes sp. NPDC051859]|uniref:hypothetical protein n=1 Tax=Actinoplanes sp. NPDC051859 TaxID=3363909 RepID=UPI0037BB6EBB